MSEEREKAVSRRAAIATGIAGATMAVLPVAGLSGFDERNEEAQRDESPHKKTARERMPVAFVPHGGGPWPFVDMGLDRTELEELASYLRSLSSLSKQPPKALLVISAHWEESVPTVMTAAQPSLYYDYYGFPPESYRITWPAPGQPALAARVRALLGAKGFDTAENGARGFDHGTFIPLKLTYPRAEVPTVQLSLKRGLDPAEHLAMGRALAPLRDEGVLIVGSGMTYHNMRGFGDPRSGPISQGFDQWLRETAGLEPEQRNQRLVQWTSAPHARAVHPREEHLLPLMVVAGAALDDRGRTAYSGSFMGVRLSAYHFG